MDNFSNNLKELRLSQNKTILDVERETGIKNANISRWENGKVIPGADMCIRLAEYYGVSVDYLLGLEDDFGKTVIGSVPVGSPDSARSAVSTADDLLSPEERKLIADYRKLDKVSKRAIERTASSLAEDPGDKVKQLFGENKR